MKTPIEEREAEFRKEVYAVGGMKYTKEMLDNFISKWTEPDRATGKRQKMRFEKQETWRTSGRLATWAKNNFDNIQCFLTDAEKTIAQKKHAFAKELEAFLPLYNRDTLNEFYRYWAMAENKPGSTTLRYENEDFWETSTRLQQWKSRNEVMVKQKVG